ncbi:MAG: tRNA glutamyl-Q(34) synthetase GluQRS [Succinivibrionaceae bacterium]
MDLNPYHCYRGRFAPTPSGELHFGSLVAAVGSFLRAKSQKGLWLLRIEDIDSTRCKSSYTTSILKTLEAFGLHWDGNITYQSQRLDIYQSVLNKLFLENYTYYCNCTRALIKTQNGIHNDQYCRAQTLKHNLNPKLNQSPENYNIRFLNNCCVSAFKDEIHGQIFNNQYTSDFILKRKDGLFAYNFVCVYDDLDSKITEIVRGNDLLTQTFNQISLTKTLQDNNLVSFKEQHNYLHLPLALENNYQKYSKQNHATPLDLQKIPELLVKAFEFLGIKITPDDKKELLHLSPFKILKYGTEKFNINNIPKNNKIII